MKKLSPSIPLKTSLIYIAFAAMWIFFSDRYLSDSVTENATLTTLQTYKGFLFVIITGILLFLIMSSAFRKIGREKKSRLESDAKLSESEKRYTLIFENSNEAILLTDPSGKIYAANPAACLLFGKSEEEICKIGRDGIVDANDPRLQNALIERSKTGLFKGELNLVRKNGILFPAEVSTAIYKDMDGNERTSMIIRDLTEQKRSEKILQDSVNRYRSTLDNMLEGCQILGFDWRYLYVNNAADIHNRRPKEELLGNRYMDMWPGIEKTEVFKIIKQCLEARTSSHFENEFEYPDGKIGWFDLSIQPIPEGVFILSMDISERKSSELEKAKLNRIYKVLSNINQLIVRTKDKETIFKEACNIAVRDGKFLMAWIGLKNVQTNKVDVVAHAGFTGDYVDKINIDLNDKKLSSGPTGQTVLHGKYHIASDIEQDSGMALWKSRALSMGYRSSAAFPLLVNNIVVGAISFYSSEKNFFAKEEIDLLNELSADISFAIQVLEIEGERKTYFQALQSSEEKYRSLIEISSDAIFINQNNKIVYLNPEALRLFGISQFSQAIGRSPFEFFHPDFHSLMQSRIEKLRRQGGSSALVENRVVRADGTEIDVEVAATLFQYKGAEAIQVVFRDISARKKAENDLRESEKQYRLLAENVSDVLWVLDLESRRFKYCSPSAIRLSGYTAEEVLQQSLEETITTESLNAVMEIIPQRIQDFVNKESGADTYHMEIEQRCKDGTTVWTEVNTRIVLNDQDKIEIIGISRNISERKLSEEKIRESEERLRLSMQAAHQGWYDLNIQSGEAIVSDEYATMIGYDPKSFVETNKYWIERLHPDDKEQTARAYQEYIAGKTDQYKVEFRQKTKSGVWKWILSLGKIVETDKNGLPLRMVGTHTDISEIKQAEEIRLLQTTALEAAANGIVITNTKGNIIWVNSAWCDMTGYSSGEVIGRNPRILNSGKQSQECYENLWETILSGNVWQGDMINRRKDGTYYHDESTITPVTDSAGKITHFIGVKQDVTERTKTTEKIELQALLLDEAHDAIILRDMDFKILYWNKGAEKIYGWKSEEVIGKDAREILYQDAQQYSQEFQQLFETGKYYGEMHHITKDNKKLLCDVRFTIRKDRDRNPSTILSIASDITDKKKTEIQLLRTQRLSSLGTLASGIAHDLNNVLAPILLAIEFLKRQHPENNTQKILASVESSAKRGAEIVKQILAFARGVESKKIVLQSRHLIDELVKVFKETFPRSINIVNNIPKNVWTIIGDSTHFHQLIMNLGVNARDAMPNGGTLSIEAENIVIDEQYANMNATAIPGRYVKFSISDTGIGMRKEMIERIFEPFFTTKEIGKGTGLGLSTVYSIVKSHDGFIDVKSELGKGTTFYIYLPASDSTEIPNGKNGTEESLLGNGELILVVDDEQSIREVTKQTLELSNYSVITASEGTDAIGKFAEHKSTIALVITDMMMPIMDGNQLISALRKISPTVKIIASSGLIDKPNVEVNSFLEKPYTAESLLSVVRKVLTQLE